MTRKIFLLGTFLLFLLNCSRSNEEMTITKGDTTTITPTPSPPPKKNDTKINITATGRQSYENITLYLEYKPTALGEKLSPTGKATFHLDKYIDTLPDFFEKELTIFATEIIDKKTINYPNLGKVRIQKNNSIEVSITIPPAPPVAPKHVYDAEISVVQDGSPLPNAKVYAMSKEVFSILSRDPHLISHRLLEKHTNITTNEQGIANFSQLPVNPLFPKYVFVVLTREGSLTHPAEYYKIEIDMNGKQQKGIITIPKSTTLTVYVVPDGKGKQDIPLNTRASLYTHQNTLIPPIYTTDVTNGIAIFKNIAPGTYYLKAEETNCIKSDFIQVNVVKSKDNQGHIKRYKQGSLSLKNSSSNPYKVEINNSQGKTIISFIMKGKSTKEVNLKEDNISVKVIQQSGYLLYATEESYHKNIACGQTPNICFPSDQCN